MVVRLGMEDGRLGRILQIVIDSIVPFAGIWSVTKIEVNAGQVWITRRNHETGRIGKEYYALIRSRWHYRGED